MFRARSIFTSQDFSWLQKGQVNWVSRVPVIFFFGGGFRLDFLRPITAEGIKPSLLESFQMTKGSFDDKTARKSLSQMKGFLVVLLQNEWLKLPEQRRQKCETHKRKGQTLTVKRCLVPSPAVNCLGGCVCIPSHLALATS